MKGGGTSLVPNPTTKALLYETISTRPFLIFLPNYKSGLQIKFE